MAFNLVKIYGFTDLKNQKSRPNEYTHGDYFYYGYPLGRKKLFIWKCASSAFFYSSLIIQENEFEWFFLINIKWK